MAKKNITDELLKRLNEYNESLLEDESEVKKQRKIKKLSPNDEVSESVSHSRPNRRQKKKEKRKRKQEELLKNSEHEEKNNKSDHSSSKIKGEKRTLLELRDELGLEEYERKIEKVKKEKEAVSTKNGPEIIVYENPSKRKRKKEIIKWVETGEDEDTIDLKKARYEVRKFGIKGLDQSKKEEAMVAMLVQLGAKPPKNKYYNYKEYVEKRKTEIEQQKKQKEIDRGLGYKVAPNRGKRRQKDRNDVGGFIDGQVGRFKHGVQFVNKHELKGFNNKRKK